MKTAGIIGGIGPESTIEYYRSIVAAYRQQRPDGSWPPLVIDSIDLKKMLDLVAAGALEELTGYLSEEVHRLARAGADFGALAANTPHVVFEALQRRAPIPLISIVEATCRAAGEQGLRCLGLFGTRFTMEGRFYRDTFEAAGMTVVVPEPADRDFVHDIYVNELLNGVVRPETRRALLAIVAGLRAEKGIEGLILGGTELSLILGGTTDAGIPLLDTTRIHVREIVAMIVS